MTVREIRRAATLDRIADHMLQHGLAPSSLRALAQAAGTSDRMLLYYFADKDDLFTAALHTIFLRIAAVLAEVAPPGPPMPAPALLQDLAAVCRSAALRPFMQVWLELAVLAARGEQPFRRVAGQIAEFFKTWVEQRLDMADASARSATAARLIATIDGLVLLDCVGCAAHADLALDAAASPG
jgi:AcrR family transcriptional regulator